VIFRDSLREKGVEVDSNPKREVMEAAMGKDETEANVELGLQSGLEEKNRAFAANGNCA
jgi:hypothetical protein